MKNLLCICALFIAATSYAQSIQEVDDFSRVMLDVDAEVEIVYSSESKVMMSLPQEEVDGIVVSSKNGSLTIKQTSSKSYSNLRIRIYTDRLDGLAVMSNGNVNLRNFKTQDNLIIQSDGSSVIDTGETTIKNLTINRSSKSKVMYKNSDSVKESVDGVMTSMN
jgi:hypothetical protein